MHKTLVPVSVNLLDIIAKYLDPILPTLKPSHKQFRVLKKLLVENVNFAESDDFRKSPRIIAWFQLQLLASLTMFEGLTAPSINQILEKDRKVTIKWVGGFSDSFMFGEYDENFEKFARYFGYRVIGLKKLDDGIPATLAISAHNMISKNLETLKKTRTFFEDIISGKLTFSEILDNDSHSVAFFVLMASLPSDVLNTLFSTIYSHFPEDLNVKTPEGNELDVCDLFGSKTEDLSFLMTKVLIYFTLYFSTEMPIIKEITRTVTKDYFESLLSNTKTNTAIYDMMRSVCSTQFETRIRLLSIFSGHMEKIFR